MSLEEILKKRLNCKKPFYKNPKLVGKYANGEESYEFLTAAGNKAYDKLTGILYDLQTLGLNIDANDIIENLDNIACGREN